MLQSTRKPTHSAAPGAEARWTATELDANGAYEATYERRPDRVQKVKTRYTAPGPGAAIEVLESSTTIRLAADGWPSAFESAELLRASVGALAWTGRTQASFALLSRERDPALAALAAQASTWKAFPVRAVTSPKADRRARNQQLLGKAGYADLRSGLATADVRGRSKLLGQLQALFRLHPEEASRALATWTRWRAPKLPRP